MLANVFKQSLGSAIASLMLFSLMIAQESNPLSSIDTIRAKSSLVYRTIPLRHTLNYTNAPRPVYQGAYQQVMTDSGVTITHVIDSDMIDSMTYAGDILFDDSDPLVNRSNDLLKQKGARGRVSSESSKKRFRATPRECMEILPLCQKIVSTNYYNDRAHMYLAFCYYGISDMEDPKHFRETALREAVTALVLDRNSYMRKSAVDFMCEASGLTYDDWKYEPSCFVYKDTSSVEVETDSNWAPYALTRALWKYEPGYHGILPGDSCLSVKIAADGVHVLLNAQAETECLTNLALDFRAKHGKALSSSEDINAIVAAYANGSMPEFIIYELWSPRYPTVPLYLPRERVEQTVDYVLRAHIRGK